MAARRSAPATGGIKKPHQYCPGTVAFHKTHHYQNITDLLIRKMPFKHLAREVLQDLNKPSLPCHDVDRFTSMPLLAIQESVEAFRIGIFQNET